MENENVNNAQGQQNESGTEQKTYTQEEVNAMIQSESDKRVAQALKTQQAKFEKKQSEAEKLQQMDETQRLNYKIEQLEAELAQRDKDAAIADNLRQATQIFAERNLPIQFVNYVVGEDAEEMLKSINTFDTQWKAALADAVSAKIGSSGSTPKNGSGKQVGITRERFNKMSLAEQSEIARTNPTLYKELTLR